MYVVCTQVLLSAEAKEKAETPFSARIFELIGQIFTLQDSNKDGGIEVIDEHGDES